MGVATHGLKIAALKSNCGPCLNPFVPVRFRLDICARKKKAYFSEQRRGGFQRAGHVTMCSQTCVSTVCPFMTVFANLMWGTVSGKLNTSYHGAVFSPYKEGVALIHSSSVHSVIFFQDLFYFYDCYACLMYMQHVFAWCPRRSEEHPQIL